MNTTNESGPDCILLYHPNQCCCGKYQNLEEPLIHNNTLHEPLGPRGNFCGPVDKHIIRDLMDENEDLKDTIKTLQTKIFDLERDIWRRG